jgi:hypothetical protein
MDLAGGVGLVIKRSCPPKFSASLATNVGCRRATDAEPPMSWWLWLRTTG